jgi:hypothetical protein
VGDWEESGLIGMFAWPWDDDGDRMPVVGLCMVKPNPVKKNGKIIWWWVVEKFINGEVPYKLCESMVALCPDWMVSLDVQIPETQMNMVEVFKLLNFKGVKVIKGGEGNPDKFLMSRSITKNFGRV